MSSGDHGADRRRRFDGRVAVVTGSTQGVGEALAHLMVDEGLAGAVVTGRNLERGEAVAAALGAKGCDAVFVSAALDDADAADRIVVEADRRFGRIDHLANCAALTDRGTVWDTTVRGFDAMQAVNVRAPLQLISGVARVARRNGTPASIVNVGSVSGHGGQDNLLAYSVSKGALITLTKNVAYQLMRHRVRVNIVNPGWMDSPGEDATQRRWHGAQDGWLSAAGDGRPWGRLVSIEELANTLAFVLSDESGLMSGAVIDLDQSVQGAGDAPVPPAELGP